MENYFKHSPQHPAHISVGAVLFNEKGEICTHFFKKVPFIPEKIVNVHILMRETMEMGETPEGAVHRGLKEEFGATGTLITFIGSKVDHVDQGEEHFQKTTLYFLVRLIDINVAKRSKEDLESDSVVSWTKPEMLIDLMKDQGARLSISSLDESDILKKALVYMK